MPSLFGSRQATPARTRSPLDVLRGPLVSPRGQRSPGWIPWDRLRHAAVDAPRRLFARFPFRKRPGAWEAPDPDDDPLSAFSAESSAAISAITAEVRSRARRPERLTLLLAWARANALVAVLV